MKTPNPSEDKNGLDRLESRLQRVTFPSPPTDLRKLCLDAAAGVSSERCRALPSRRSDWSVASWFRGNPIGWSAIGLAWVAALGFWISSLTLAPMSSTAPVARLSAETERLAVEQRAELMVLLRSEGVEIPRSADRPKTQPKENPARAPRSALALTNYLA
jgi:hypothetical protein